MFTTATRKNTKENKKQVMFTTATRKNTTVKKKKENRVTKNGLSIKVT